MAYKRSYTSSSSSKSTQHDNSPETIINLDAKKRVTVRKFNNVNLVDIREFYVDANGESKPGKKGISLTEDTYFKLVEAHNKIEHALDGLNGGAQKKAKVEPVEEKKKEEKEARKEKKEVKPEQAAAPTTEAAASAGDDVDDAGVPEDDNDDDGDFVVGDDEVEEEEDDGEEEVSEADE
ncbi:hypothetical protein I9W82_003460 [Candida metapsilosis]|uniref:Transcriptional coactivator p15 (PC4) C-terminal domain-containing protein n=1 Tax=Candida metapsilosis TaxID=273372 RepID=A0A8H7ZHH5_9ASCO|nr:hypothetical protein I9W82_003460 [Candida metapsilosis]